ncbi:MAG: hypothetical protein ACR2M0_07005 [Chloroflexia bacterium]
MPPNEVSIDVGSQETAEAVAVQIEDLRLPMGTPVRLNMPDDAIVLKDYNPLLALRKRAGLRLIVVSPEPIIRTAAFLAGLESAEPEAWRVPVSPNAIGDEASSTHSTSPPGVIDSTARVLGGAAAQEAARPNKGIAFKDNSTAPGRPANIKGSAGAAVASRPGAASPLGTPSRAQNRRRRRWSPLIVPLALLLILLCLGGIFLTNTSGLVTASVHIRPIASAPLGPIAINVPVQVGEAANGGPHLSSVVVPIMGTTTVTATGGSEAYTSQPVQAQKITATIISHKGLPTTGSRQQPKDFATGTIEFTSLGADSVPVPKSLELKTNANGKVLLFYTVKSITVPGTDFVGHTFGVRDVDVIAAQPGPDYNGARLGGGYGTASFVTIRVTSGGTTVAVKTVAQKDLTDLQTALKNDITANAGKDLLAQVAKDPTLLPISCTMSADIFAGASVQSAPQSGADADTVSGVITTTVTVYAFHPAEAQHQAAMAVQDALPTLPSPMDAQMDTTAVQENTLPLNQTSGCAGGTVVYSTQVDDAVLRYNLPSGPALENQIRKLIAQARTPGEAVAKIKASPLGPYLADVQVDARLFGTSQDKMPTSPANIQVLVEQPGRPK